MLTFAKKQTESDMNIGCLLQIMWCSKNNWCNLIQGRLRTRPLYATHRQGLGSCRSYSLRSCENYHICVKWIRHSYPDCPYLSSAMDVLLIVLVSHRWSGDRQINSLGSAKLSSASAMRTRVVRMQTERQERDRMLMIGVGDSTDY